MSSPLLDTQAAFDSVAADYDGPLGNNELVQYLRAQTLAAVESNFPPGSALLDLGCGTGLDAGHLARAGYRINALDWSAEMVKRTQARIDRAGLSSRLTVRHLGIHQLDELPPGVYAGAYSNLGPLNCVPDLAGAALSLARLLAPGALLVASVIGQVCPWEVLVFAARGDWERARFRFSHDFRPAPLNGHRAWTRYYTPAEFEREFAGAGFRRRSLRALGLFVPPPYMLAFAGRHPRMIRAAQALDTSIGGWPLLRNWGDHFLIVLQKS